MLMFIAPWTPRSGLSDRSCLSWVSPPIFWVGITARRIGGSDVAMADLPTRTFIFRQGTSHTSNAYSLIVLPF